MERLTLNKLRRIGPRRPTGKNRQGMIRGAGESFRAQFLAAQRELKLILHVQVGRVLGRLGKARGTRSSRDSRQQSRRTDDA